MEPSGGYLQEIDIPKNNGSKKGISIRFPNINAAPMVYPDFYYQDWKEGKPMDEIVSGVRDEIIRTAPDLSRLSIKSINRDSAPAHLYAAVVGYESNKEWLKSTPHERVADLAVFAKWRFDGADRDSVVASIITEPLLAHLQLTKEEVLKIAKTNTAQEEVFKSLEEIVMPDGMDREMEEAMGYMPLPIYILSNKNGIDGAAMIACPEVLKMVQEKLGGDFYILPSSIHEVLTIPKSEMDDVEDLKDMVQSVNQSSVPPEDRLSDQVYEFDGHSLKIAGSELTQENNITDSITHHRSR